jgi:hypothetical protein
MIRTGHKSVVDAKRELVKNGYTIVHTPPGTALRWARPSEFKHKNRRDFAVATAKRARSTAVLIVLNPGTPHEQTVVLDRSGRCIAKFSPRRAPDFRAFALLLGYVVGLVIALKVLA